MLLLLGILSRGQQLHDRPLAGGNWSEADGRGSAGGNGRMFGEDTYSTYGGVVGRERAAASKVSTGAFVTFTLRWRLRQQGEAALCRCCSKDPREESYTGWPGIGNLDLAFLAAQATRTGVNLLLPTTRTSAN